MTIDQASTRFETADEYFASPWIDLDEWRDAPVRHRYVHGGFAGTETRFSFYLPEADRYEGRFFQHITPVPESENLAQGKSGIHDPVGMSIASGAYFVETNGGGQVGGPGFSADQTIGAFRANAAAAQFSRVVAAEMYGEHRPFGYSYGGSGGGFRTIGGAENTSGVWDGFVPYVIGSPMAIPNVFSVRMHAQRVLRDKLDGIVDAVEPGGSGDPWAGLDEEESDALREVTRMGFPLRSWFAHPAMGMHAFSVLYPGLRIVDPSYFDDFWTVPGYLGASPTASLVRDRVQLACSVVETLTAGDLTALGLDLGPIPGTALGDADDGWLGARGEARRTVAVRLSERVGESVTGADLVVVSGALAGSRIGLMSVDGDVALFGPADPDALAQLRPGDAVDVDNSGFLAAQTYHRHQVPGPDYPVWDQFRNPDGSPIYPQRPMIVGPMFAAGASGTVQSGRFEGRMIVVGSLLDREAFVWQSDWYRRKVQEHLGDATDDRFRLWFVENAVHGDGDEESPEHTVSYLGVLHQALRDVAAWVERGVEPLPTTSYQVVDGQVILPAAAGDRNTHQAVLALAANGSSRAEVRTGEVITLSVEAEMPRSAGRIVGIEWDTTGVDGFGPVLPVEPIDRLVSAVQVAFDRPGTYFPVVRVSSQRDGDATDIHTRVTNVARVRVVVA